MQRRSILCTLLALAATTVSAQDPAKVAGNQCKVAFENDYVRVLHWTVGPGVKAPMHEHPALVSVSLSAGKTRFTLPDGKTREAETRAGQATWSEAEKHASENLGAERGNIIQVELKQKPGAAMTKLAAAEDSITVDPDHYKVEFQNDRVRVLRIHYGPNERSVMHAHPASVAVFVTDSQATFTFPDGKTAPSVYKAGQVQWSDAGKHLPANTSARPFELILVELR